MRDAVATSPSPTGSQEPLQSRPTLRPRRNAVRRPDDALPASSPPLGESVGHLRTSPRNDRACTLLHGVWSRASDAESLAAFCCRRPFKNRWRRMPCSQLENPPRPSKRAKDCHASTSVSCTRSSAQWLSLQRASAQRHMRAAYCSANCSNAVASPAWARSINSRWSSSGVFTIPVIPLFRPKGSLARAFSCEFLLPEPLGWP